MEFTEQQREGAAWVLGKALGAEDGDSVLVIHDDVNAATARCFKTVARARKISLHTLPVSAADQ